MKFLRLFPLVLLVLLCSCVRLSNPKVPDKVSLAKDLRSETIALYAPKRVISIIDGEIHIDVKLKLFCSGVWVSDTEILTASHCVEAFHDPDNVLGAPMIYVTADEAGNPGDKPTDYHWAMVTWHDNVHDLSLLAVAHSAGDTVLPGDQFRPEHKVAKVAHDNPVQGEHLEFMGHPSRLNWTYFEGYMAAIRPDFPEAAQELGFVGPWLQVSAPIWHGNSGGGAFNEYGELVGICSYGDDGTPNNGFFVATITLRKFLIEAHECSGGSCKVK